MSIFLSILSGILLILSFPKANLYLLVYIALVPLLYALEQAKDVKQSLFYGFIAGVVFFGGILFWVNTLFAYVGGWAILGWFLLALYQALFIALFALLVYVLRPKHPWLKVIVIPAAWVVLEWLRSLGAFGVTGGGLGYTQYAILPLIQVSVWTGVYGVSFLLVMINVMIVDGLKSLSIRRIKKGQVGQIVFVAAAVLLVYIYGATQVQLSSSDGDPSFKVAIVQGNIPQKVKLAGTTYKMFRVYENLTKKISPQDTDLVIWPETAITNYLMRDTYLLSRLKKLAKKGKGYLIVGTPHYLEKKIYNSAFIISPQGKVVGRYDKERLVPFGEYLPFKYLLRPLLRYTSLYDFFEGDYEPNFQPQLLPVSDLKVGTLICFESTFPYLARKRLKKGADFILVITNDAWFKKSAAAWQHLIAGVFRAVEGKTYFVQAANTGISAIIDPYGRIVERTKLDEQKVLLGRIFSRKGETFYSRFGDGFVYLWIVVLGVLLVFRYRSAKITAAKSS